jgi:hypothetical protein
MNFLNGLEPGNVVSHRALNRVLVYGFMRSIRKAYLGKLHEALALSVVTENRGQRRNEHANNMKRVETLRKAYEALDEAVLSGNQARIQKASRRMKAIDQAIAMRGSRDYEGLTGNKAKVMGLSAATSAMMRDRALQVLDYLTNPQYLGAPKMAGGDSVYSAGRLDLLETIKTPSATRKLMQKETGSQYDILWRHLEFGTGIYASKAQVMGQQNLAGNDAYKNADGSWWYGPPNSGTQRKRGLLVRGSSPMNVMWGPSGLANTQHAVAAQAELNRAMEDMAPRFT